MNENITGITYTTTNLINPLKINKVKSVIKESLVNLPAYTTDEKAQYIYANLKIDTLFKIMDIYKKDDKIYVFTKFSLKSEGHKINKLLFVLNESISVQQVMF